MIMSGKYTTLRLASHNSIMSFENFDSDWVGGLYKGKRASAGTRVIKSRTNYFDREKRDTVQ